MTRLFNPITGESRELTDEEEEILQEHKRRVQERLKSGKKSTLFKVSVDPQKVRRK